MNDSPDDERTAMFLRLYAESELVLRAFVRSLVPTREMASEVIQDVLLVLWRKFESAENFRAWSFGVARKVVARHMRSRARDRHVFDDELAEKLAEDTLRLSEVHHVQRDALEHCLEGLKPEHRDLLLSAYSKGVKMDELARRRGQSPMSLYKWLHRVRMALFECVQRRVRREGMA
jgi:RNA polymerase sigma-70 factor (ECF subfamily)